MLKGLLKEAYDFLAHLSKTGYFDESDVPRLIKAGDRTRGPENTPRRKGQKLYQKEVLEIYKDKHTSAEDLATLFDVTASTIYDIKNGKTWSKLTGHQK
jgi:DNA invertase Pin-like site-specific DNA recombinase